MLQDGVRGNRRSKEEELRIKTEIHKLLPMKDDDEIMDILGLPNSTYYRYKSKIHREARKIWKRACKESLEYRALQVKKSLELCIKVNQEIALDTAEPPKDRIVASQVIVDAHLDLFRLILDGPDVTKRDVIESKSIVDDDNVQFTHDTSQRYTRIRR